MYAGIMSKHVPALIIGSIVKVCPAFITPTALFPGQYISESKMFTEAASKRPKYIIFTIGSFSLHSKLNNQ